MRRLFGAVACAVAGAALVLVGSAAPAAGDTSVAAAPDTVRQAVAGPGYTPPPLPVAQGKQPRGAWTGPYTYRNGRSGKCLDILGASKERGAAAVQYTCVAGGRSQMWWDYLVENDGFGYSRLIGNDYSGKCLHADGKNIPIKQLDCVILVNQTFDTTSANPHLLQQYYCLEVQGASPSNFARIVLWDCHGRSQQIWYRYNA